MKNKIKQRVCGIYCWEAINLQSSQFGGRYIGKSKNIWHRKSVHLANLRHQKHKNLRLQRYFNKYGENSLKFIILIECEENNLTFWEKFFIKILLARQYFNDTDGGEGVSLGQNARKCTLQNIFTNELITTDSIAEFAKKYNLSISGISAVLNRKAKMTGDWFCPANDWKPKFYELISPRGELIKFINITDFSNLHKLKPRGVAKLLKKKCETYFGWTRPDSRLITRVNPSCKPFKLLNPLGNIVEGLNISQFCRENGLERSSMSALIRGELGRYKGWKVYSELGIYKETKFIKQFKFLNPKGEIIEHFGTMVEFSRKYNLDEKVVSKLYKGELKFYKGWSKV